MTVTFELAPEVQAGLLNQAEASGLSLEAYVEQVLREQSLAGIGAEAMLSQPAHGLSPEERLHEFHDWLNSHLDNTVVLPDEAMEHESVLRRPWPLNGECTRR